MVVIIYFITLSCLLNCTLDIEAQILEIQGMKAALLEEGDQGVGLDSTGFYDQEIYGGSDSRFAGYVTSIAANEQEEVVHQLIFHVYLPLFSPRWTHSVGLQAGDPPLKAL